jgi:uncharacterized membrane protein YfcA
MEMAWYFYPAVIAAGFGAGFINTLAGSGSLITLPLLIFMGLPATVANGTNRIGILMQNIVGVGSFHRTRLLDIRGTIILGVPATVGSILGAQIAVNLNEVVMRRTIGAMLLIMMGVMLVRPQRWLEARSLIMEGHPGLLQLGLFFLIGIYGGFLQAGVGIFLLAGLVLAVGYDLVRANAVKVGIVLFYIPFTLLVFLRNGQVNAGIGFVLGLGNMLGAWVAVHTAAEKGNAWVRRLLIVVIVLSAAELLGLFSLVGQLLRML